MLGNTLNLSSMDSFILDITLLISSVDYSMCVLRKPWPVLAPPCLYKALCVGVIGIV